MERCQKLYIAKMYFITQQIQNSESDDETFKIIMPIS